MVGGLVDETVVDVTVVGVARTVVADATVVAVARATVVGGAIVAIVARMVVVDSLKGAFVPGVVEAGVEAIDEGVGFASTVEPVDFNGAVTGPVGAFSTIAA